MHQKQLNRKSLRVRELAEAAGVSVQTIHFYLREGLLQPPIKTAPNMAYYGQEHIEDIRLIKELQQKRYLPLSVIKLMLEAKRQGKNTSDLENMRLSLEEIFRPLGPEEELEPVSLIGLLAMTGLPATTLEALEGMGLLMPTSTPKGKLYDGLDVRICRALKKLLDLGLKPQELNFYSEYVELLQREIRTVRERIVPGPALASRASEIKQSLDDIKAALAAKVYRRAALEFKNQKRVNRGKRTTK